MCAYTLAYAIAWFIQRQLSGSLTPTDIGMCNVVSDDILIRI